ncbi:MAG: diacylglycerol kinase [Helicobacteraceae bacterium]|jgi:diacylglycerol kinase (ATP)|nr:diacylglycerol kinase [Helicobacteraceae bacterium]
MAFEKPSGFSLWRNFINSLNGFIEVSRRENPMKAELIVLAAGVLVLIFWDIAIWQKAVLLVSLLLIILAELVNSSIERVVDLVTKDFHELAKHAKDAASAGVLVAILIALIAWAVVAHIYFFGS